MDYRKVPRVDAYIDALPAWQQGVCRQVRDLVHAVDPGVAETIKRTVQPYFVLDGNLCALLAAKDHVNIFLYDGGIVPDPAGIITAGHGNKTAHCRRPPGRGPQRPGTGRNVRPDRRQQPRGRLAQAQARRGVIMDRRVGEQYARWPYAARWWARYRPPSIACAGRR